MLDFEQTKAQLSTKVCLGSQGNILTEKVMALCADAYEEGYVDGRDDEKLDTSNTSTVFLQASDLTLEALKLVVDARIDATGSNPAKKALRDLLEEVEKMVASA